MSVETSPASQVIGPFTVTDVTGQKSQQISIPSDTTVNEVCKNLLGYLNQPAHDSDGRPITYGVRSENEGRFLGGNERIGDALQPNDTLRLMPTVEAGRGSRG